MVPIVYWSLPGISSSWPIAICVGRNAPQTCKLQSYDPLHVERLQKDHCTWTTCKKVTGIINSHSQAGKYHQSSITLIDVEISKVASTVFYWQNSFVWFYTLAAVCRGKWRQILPIILVLLSIYIFYPDLDDNDDDIILVLLLSIYIFLSGFWYYPPPFWLCW